MEFITNNSLTLLLLALIAIGEWLGSTKRFEANNILQVTMMVLRKIVNK